MVKRSTALLALIYNHLLQHGLSQTARKLQQESGENFNSQKKTLDKMYKHWNKKDKKSSKKSAQSKKTRQPGPVSTESSEDKGDEAKEAALVAKSKAVSGKKTGKMKLEEPKTMNSPKKPAAKAKSAPRTKKAAPRSKTASAQDDDDPNSKEEVASPKPAPLTEPPLKPTRAATTRSRTTNCKAAKQPKRVSAKTTAAAAKPLVAANGEAVVKNDVSDDSESSDETDIEKQKAQTPEVFQIKAAASRPAKTTAAQAKAKRGSSKTTDVTPTSKVSTRVRKTPAKTKETSEDLNSEIKRVPTPAVSKVKAAASSAKTTAAKTKKGSSKPTAVTPAPAAGTTPAETMILESSEESDLDSEFVPSSLEATAQSDVVTSYQKAPVRPTTLQSTMDDSSESSETESEDEPVKQNQKKTTSPIKRTIPTSPAKVARAQTPKPEAAQDSETSDDSDSEPEIKAPQVPTPAVAATKRTSRAKPTAVTPASQSSGVAVRSPAKMAAAEESSEESDSDDAVPTPAVAATKRTSRAKPTAVTSASQSSGVAVRSPAKMAEERSEESDSDDAPSSSVKAPGLTIGSPSLRPSAPIPTHVPDSDAESESSDSSDSDVKSGQKVITSRKKTAAKSPASAAKTIVTGKVIAQPKPSQDSSEASESEEEEPQPALATLQQTSPALSAKEKRGVFTAAQPDEESSSEESDDDSDEPVTSVSQNVPTPAVAVRKLSYTTKPSPLMLLSQGSAAKMATDETSEDSDSDDEPSSAVRTPNLTRGTPSSAPTPARVPDSDADSESSDSSDSEERAGLKDQASQTKIAANLLSPVGKIKVEEMIISHSVPSQDHSETSESEEEKSPLSVAVSQKRKPALAATGKQGFAAAGKPDESSSEETEDSDEPGTSVPTPAIAARKSITKSTALTPASQSRVSAVSSPVKMAADESSEDSDSDEVESPAPTPAKSTVKKGKSALSTPTPSKLVTVKSASKTPLAVKQANTSIKSPESEAKKKTTATTLAKHKSSTSIPILTSTPAITSPSKGKAGLKMAPVLAKDTSDSESDENESKQVTTPAPTSTKAMVKKGIGANLATPPKVRAVKSADPCTPPVAKGASNSSESDSSKERAAQLLSSPIVQTKLEQFFPKQSPTTERQPKPEIPTRFATSSSETYDSEEESAAEEKLASQLSQKAVRKTAAKVSKDVPGRAGDSVDDMSELEGSQSLLQAKPKKRKLSLNKKDKTTPAHESTETPSGKKAKVQTQAEEKPTPVAGLLDSEEETVLALLEGRSPKKAKSPKKNSSSTKNGLEATTTLKDSNALEKSLPRSFGSFPSEDDDFNMKSPEIGQLSAKKSSKKRKGASQDSLLEEHDKKAKKAKEEKLLMASSEAEEATSPKSSRKEKSEKDKKKNSDKGKRESKKLMQSLMASLGESTDSGVGLQSKPKKKRVKGDQE